MKIVPVALPPNVLFQPTLFLNQGKSPHPLQRMGTVPHGFFPTLPVGSSKDIGANSGYSPPLVMNPPPLAIPYPNSKTPWPQGR